MDLEDIEIYASQLDDLDRTIGKDMDDFYHQKGKNKHCPFSPDPVVGFQKAHGVKTRTAWGTSRISEDYSPPMMQMSVLSSTSSSPTAAHRMEEQQLQKAEKINDQMRHSLKELEREVGEQRAAISSLRRSYSPPRPSSTDTSSHINSTSPVITPTKPTRRNNTNTSNGTVTPNKATSLAFGGTTPNNKQRSKYTTEVLPDPTDIPTSVNQEYWGIPQAPTIVSRLKPGEKWFDSDFPPDNKSIGKEMAERIYWCRPRDIYDVPKLFKQGDDNSSRALACAADVEQGALGDCWLLSAMSIIGTRPDLLSNLVVSSYPEQGVYEFRFYKHGKWHLVCVDDQIPCVKWNRRGSRPQPVFSHSKDDGELWVPLLEKAYAKLMGSYAVLEGGQIHYALVDMTGGVSDTIDVNQGNGEGRLMIRNGALLTKIRQVKAEGWLMGCSFVESKRTTVVGGSGETGGNRGLISGHAYSLLDIRKVRDTWLLRIRNPWGRGEWQGPWSDGAREWNATMLDELQYKFQNDGTFWMAYDDFKNEVNSISICRTYNHCPGDPFWQLTQQYHGRIDKTTPDVQFCLQTDDDAIVWVDLTQEDYRWTHTQGKGSFCTGVKVFEGLQYHPRPYARKSKGYAQPMGMFVWGRRSVGVEVICKADTPYVVTPLVYGQSEGTSFMSLTAYCATSFKMRRTDRHSVADWQYPQPTPICPHTRNASLPCSLEFRSAHSPEIEATLVAHSPNLLSHAPPSDYEEVEGYQTQLSAAAGEGGTTTNSSSTVDEEETPSGEVPIAYESTHADVKTRVLQQLQQIYRTIESSSSHSTVLLQSIESSFSDYLGLLDSVHQSPTTQTPQPPFHDGLNTVHTHPQQLQDTTSTTPGMDHNNHNEGQIQQQSILTTIRHRILHVPHGGNSNPFVTCERILKVGCEMDGQTYLTKETIETGLNTYGVLIDPAELHMLWMAVTRGETDCCVSVEQLLTALKQ